MSLSLKVWSMKCKFLRPPVSVIALMAWIDGLPWRCSLYESNPKWHSVSGWGTFLKGRIATKFVSKTNQLRMKNSARRLLKRYAWFAQLRCHDPDNIEDYIAEDGYQALGKYWPKHPWAVIDIILRSGLRGRVALASQQVKKCNSAGLPLKP